MRFPQVRSVARPRTLRAQRVREIFSYSDVYKRQTVNFSDGTAQVAAAIRPETKALYIETPTNPMMHVTDIRKAAELVHAHGALLIVDNTFLSPYLQNPLTLGADIVIHSGTKYLSGHNDTLAGFAVIKDAALAARLREISKTIGANLAPFDAWLLLRGIQTLAVRMDLSLIHISSLTSSKRMSEASRIFWRHSACFCRSPL